RSAPAPEPRSATGAERKSRAQAECAARIQSVVIPGDGSAAASALVFLLDRVALDSGAVPRLFDPPTFLYPEPQQVPFLLAHLGQVGQWHLAGLYRLFMNGAFPGEDLFRGVEGRQQRGRLEDGVARGAGMALQAAILNDALHQGEFPSRSQRGGSRQLWLRQAR